MGEGLQTIRRAGAAVGSDGREGVGELKSGVGNSKKTGRGADARGVTFVEDTGGVYNAPLEVVWDFLSDEIFHPKAHTADVRNFKAKRLSEVSTLVSYERRNGKRWEKRVCRMTTIPPAARIQEDLGGPWAGSTTVFLYRSRGKRTFVDVFGYVPTSERTPARIIRDRKKMWAKSYSEDLPYFRQFAKQHPSVRGKPR
jgi:hypothetical protein